MGVDGWVVPVVDIYESIESRFSITIAVLKAPEDKAVRVWDTCRGVNLIRIRIVVVLVFVPERVL